MKFRPELLSPAGGLDKLKAAIHYGADAVYLAGQKFGLRSAADNFTLDELQEGVAFAHARGAKVYVVLNAFPHDRDLESLPQFLGEISELRVDGVIASDLGMISVVSRESQLPVHLSTQASCLNQASGELWKQLGVTRLIFGREVSIQEAGAIKRSTGLEVELFIHGSMCMAYSGNCTISNFTKGRDSNRGGCAQSCRFSYQLDIQPKGFEAKKISNRTFMSSKDLMGIDLLRYFVEEKIDSLKIEGRMRSPLYAATLSKVYREAIAAFDEQGELLPEQLEAWYWELQRIPHRDYMSGSLMEPADANSVYLPDDTKTVKKADQYEFLGLVRKVVPGKYLLVETTGVFSLGDTLEWLPPVGQPQKWVVSDLRSSLGEPLAKARSSALVRLPYQLGPQVGEVIRKRTVSEPSGGLSL